MEFIPEGGSSPLAEAYARKPESEALSGGALRNATELLRSNVDLEHFLWPAPPRSAIPVGGAAPSTAQGDEEVPASNTLYPVLFGLLLAILLFFVLGRRKGPRDDLLARVARLRVRQKEEEEPPPPVDLSRLERLVRRSSSGTPGPVTEPLQETAEPSSPAPAPNAEANAAMTDDLVLVERGDAAAASAAIDAARTQREAGRGGLGSNSSGPASGSPGAPPDRIS